MKTKRRVKIVTVTEDYISRVYPKDDSTAATLQGLQTGRGLRLLFNGRTFMDFPHGFDHHGFDS